MTRVFLDANVYFAGCVSEEGASAFVLELARRKKIELVSSKLVLHEADRNLRKKASTSSSKLFRQFLRSVRIRIVHASDASLKQYENSVEAKDVPVIAAAVDSDAAYFLTLDRKHFLSSMIAKSLRRPRIMNPGDFLREIYLKGKI
jgi:predicted nucleic acid-binding protein